MYLLTVILTLMAGVVTMVWLMLVLKNIIVFITVKMSLQKAINILMV